MSKSRSYLNVESFFSNTTVEKPIHRFRHTKIIKLGLFPSKEHKGKGRKQLFIM